MNTLVRRRRRTVPRRRAANALRAGACLYACHGDCDPIVAPVGLRDRDDVDAVLVCPHHLPLLRGLRPFEAARLARYLRVRFADLLEREGVI